MSTTSQQQSLRIILYGCCDKCQLTIQTVVTLSFNWINSPPQLKRSSGRSCLPVPEKMTLHKMGLVKCNIFTFQHAFVCHISLWTEIFPKPMCACVCYWNNDPAVCISHNSSVGCMLECDRLAERGNCSRVTPLSGSRSSLRSRIACRTKTFYLVINLSFAAFLFCFYTQAVLREMHTSRLVQFFVLFPLFLAIYLSSSHNAAVQWQIINIKIYLRCVHPGGKIERTCPHRVQRTPVKPRCFGIVASVWLVLAICPFLFFLPLKSWADISKKQTPKGAVQRAPVSRQGSGKWMQARW